jgi:hypothetical protein
MTSLFNRFRPESEAQRRFAGWGPPPQLQPMTWGIDLPAFPLPRPRQPQTFAPALIIGLGEIGEHVLRDWLHQLAQSSAGPQEMVRIFLLTEQPAAILPTGNVQTHQIDLASHSGAAGSPTHNQRNVAREYFRQVSVYRFFLDWLNLGLIDLHGNIRVILVGSLRESIIGVLGEVLQIIRLAPENNNPYLAVSALLTLDPPSHSTALDDSETYAVLREIGRFTFGGEHWMEPLPGGRRGIIRSALLEHLFLVEGRTTQSATIQALAETLLVLLHPSGHTIWEHLANDIVQAGQIRESSREPLVHSLGIATAAVPIRELKDYVAARLAYTAVFGEHPHRPAEGLVSPSRSSDIHPKTVETLAIRWLRGGPAHPLFDWLLESIDQTHFRFLPTVSIEFDSVFQSKLAQGLFSLLNDSTQPGGLDQCRAALTWLTQWLDTIRSQVTAVAKPPEANRQMFEHMLKRWQETTSHLNHQLDMWDKTLSASRPETLPVAGSTGEWRQSRPADLSNNWRQPNSASPNWRSPAIGSLVEEPVASFSLPGWLKQRWHESEMALTQAGDSHIRRAVTADVHDSLAEAGAYYSDTVRPELSRFDPETSMAFRRVRNRIRWWIELVPGQQPEIYLACIPPELPLAANDQPPAGSRFKVNAVNTIGPAIFQIAMMQASAVETNITESWRQQWSAKIPAFLQRSNHPMLAYDQNSAIHYPGAATRRAYLIARNPITFGHSRSSIFPNLPQHEVNELEDGDPARVTALTLWLNIPFDTIIGVRAAYNKYGHRSALHLYPQEQTAAEYERRWRALTGEPTPLFPPDFILSLANPQLVTLFCQSLIYGLIEVRHDLPGKPARWTVAAVDGFDPLPLVSGQPWLALKNFALELPNAPAIDHNPANHFHNQQRDSYLNALLAVVRSRQRQPNFKLSRDTFNTTALANWKKAGEHDLLAHAFACLIEVELDEPVWKEW